MFTWICPKCGKEVPPHESECPFCHGTGKIEEPSAAPPPQAQPPAAAPPPPPPPAQQPVQPPPPPPPPPVYQQPVPPPPPPSAAPPPQPVYQQPAAPPPPPPQYAPPPAPAAPAPQQEQYYEIGGNQRHMPGWLVTIIVALVVGGIGALLYYYVLPSNRNGSTAQTSPFEKVSEGGAAGVSKIARHIEVTGFRISEDEKQRAQVQFLVVNHSAADIGNLAGTVYLTTTESKPGDEPLLKFDFKAANLGPYSSIEFKTVVPTKLRAYELPDWQFLRARVVITSPKD